MKALWTFRFLVARQARGLLLAWLLSLLTLAAGVALLGTAGWFITAAALTTAGVAFNLIGPSALVRGFSFVRIVSRYGEKLVGHDATLRLLADLRGWLFGQLFPRLPLADISLRHGDLASRLTADVDALDTAFLVAIGPITAALVMGGAITVALIAMLPAAAPVYGLCLLCAVLVLPLAVVLLTRGDGRALVAEAAGARMAVLDAQWGLTDLTAFGVLGSAQRQFAAAITTLARTRGRLATTVVATGFVVQMLGAVALLGVLWAGVGALNNGAISGPLLVGLLLGTLASFEGIGASVRAAGKLAAAAAAAERLAELAQGPIAIRDAIATQPIPLNGHIVLQQVTFGYGRGAPALAGLDLTIHPGEHIAIVGPSGGGKSTLLKLLLRLVTPQAGCISIGGVPIEEIAVSDLHRHFAFLSQDSAIFNDTIRDNLLISRPDACETALWHALHLAGLAAHVRSLPQGLDTLVGESGSTLSAGQARRLCLARILLSPAPVLLLDEPTTGLDRQTELAFFRTLESAAVGRTVVLVTHAAGLPAMVDQVLTLSGGTLR